ncbi:SU10 major capsid protein [Paenibacillus durus]|uniref:Phage capsid protein n=1 Tax=Paenibacillus durus ATCC 35681 TaxID=1333534 RepID=A0A0F7FAH3_PAEDU|nr:DUF5309 family protein [Paenibacillus durus]AKG35259.1 hypothetical protein VK70_12290 [Paenibacillus durus ATCC 35681]
MFTSDKFVQGQNYDLKELLINTTPFKAPFTNLLLTKTVKAEAPTMNWIETSINEAAAETLAEGSDAPASVDDTLEPISNFTELVGATATISNTAQAANAVGISDLLAREIDSKTKAIKMGIENRLINGIKGYTAATKIYKTAGILEQIHTDHKLTDTTFTNDKFLETIEKIYDAGASDNLICFLPARMKLSLAQFTDFQFFAKDKVAGVDVDIFISPFGSVRFALTEKIQNKLFIVNPDYLELGELISFHGQVEPVSGSKQSVYLEWQGGVKLLNRKAAASFEIA